MDKVISMSYLSRYQTKCDIKFFWIPNPGVTCAELLGGSKVDSAFHPFEVDKMSTRNIWELSGKK